MSSVPRPIVEVSPFVELIALAVFVGAFVLSALLTPLARRAAAASGFLDRPGEHRAHEAPMPLLGGAAIFVSFGVSFWLAAYLLGTHAAWFEPAGYLSAYGPVHQLFKNCILDRLAWISAGGAAIFLLGLWDDRRPLRPWIKLLIPALVGGLLAQKGVRIDIYGPVVSTLLTMLWVAGITNAFNLLDNMDGLSAGVAVVAGLVFFAVAALTGQYVVGAAAAALAGAAAGFLPYNFHPARIFMGDAGSLFLGYVLASLTMVTTFYRYESGETILQLAMPVLVMALPIFDSASVVWIRFREGRPLFTGDRSHFSHRLVSLGMSVREAVLTNYLVALAVGLGAIVLHRSGALGGWVILLQAAGIFAVVALLERAGRRRA